MQKLSVRECIRFGWETFKKRPWILIGGSVLAIMVSIVSSSILNPGNEGNPGLLGMLMALASIVIGMLVEMGLVTFALRAHDSIDGVKVSDLWNPAPFWRYVAGQILVGLTVIAGLILLVVPGIILALGLVFSSYLIVDKNKGPVEAMKESWRITKGHKWELFLFVLAIAGLNVIGFFLLLVGLLVTIPVTMLALVHAYRKLEHAASEVAPVPTA